MTSRAASALGRGVVTGRIGPGADGRLPQGAVHPQQGGRRSHAGHDDDEGDEQAEPEQPPLGVMVEQLVDAGEEGEEAQEQDGHEGHGGQPQLADDLAVEEPRPDEVGHVAVEPLDALEEGARAPGGTRARGAGRGRRGGRRACPPVTTGLRRRCRVDLVAVHHPDPLGTVLGGHHQSRTVRANAATPSRSRSMRHRSAVPGQLAVVVAREHDHVVVGAGGELGRPPR